MLQSEERARTPLRRLSDNHVDMRGLAVLGIEKADASCDPKAPVSTLSGYNTCQY
jgi:hypothetical protein